MNIFCFTISIRSEKVNVLCFRLKDENIPTRLRCYRRVGEMAIFFCIRLGRVIPGGG